MSGAALIVGTYTARLAHVDGKAAGILSCTLTDDGLGEARVVARTVNPSYLVLTRDGGILYCVNETTEFEGRPGGGVSAFAREAGTGMLRRLNSRPSGGVEPAHICVDPSGRFVVVTNYRSGSVAVFAIAADGSLGEMTDHVQHQGASVHPVRQSGPHAHMAIFDPRAGDMLVPDLGLDAVFVYRLGDDGRLEEQVDARITTVPGAGPRHLAFHPNGAHLFLVNELNNTVTVLEREGRRFVAAHTASTLPHGFDAHSQASSVRVVASGRYVLASNRGLESDNVAMLAFDAERRHLELVHLEPSQGREPREMLVLPDGRLLVANQDSGSVVLFDVDEDSATLRPTSSFDVPTPVCLVLA